MMVLFRAQRVDGGGIVYGDLIQRDKQRLYTAIFEHNSQWHYRVREDSVEQLINGEWVTAELENEAIAIKLRHGGCPANNTKCSYLRNGICILPKPDIEREASGKYTCSSADIW